MYELGQYTRKIYQEFLPPIYPSRNVRLYSTESERCITSAQLYAAGLYPPTKEEVWNEELKWNPIPVCVVEQHILRIFKSFCSSYAKEYETAINSVMKDFKNDPTSEYISTHSGLELQNYLDFVILHDTLATQDSLGLQLPEWTKKVYPNYTKNFLLNFYDVCCFTEKATKLCK